MRLINPKSLDPSHLGELLADPAARLVIQFSQPSAYNPDLLRELNLACERFGSQLNVRFYAHSGHFDCQTLRHLPAVQSLNLDTLLQITGIGELVSLPLLQEFHFGVFESDPPDLLTLVPRGLRKLTLAPSRRNNIDLAPMPRFTHLQTLFVGGHTHGIETIGELHSLADLSLGSIGKRQSLTFVSNLPALRRLMLILGGRDQLDAANKAVTQLEILRVRALTTLDLHLFPALQSLLIEDQLQLRSLDLQPVQSTLQYLSLSNCKSLKALSALKDATHLVSLRSAQTALNAEDLLTRLPPSLRQLSLHGYGKATDAALAQRIASLGLAPAP